MEKHSTSTISTGSGFALVEVLTLLAILSVIATIAFFIFVVGEVETNPENGNPHVEHRISHPFEPSSPLQSDSPSIAH